MFEIKLFKLPISMLFLTDYLHAQDQVFGADVACGLSVINVACL